VGFGAAADQTRVRVSRSGAPRAGGRPGRRLRDDGRRLGMRDFVRHDPLDQALVARHLPAVAEGEGDEIPLGPMTLDGQRPAGGHDDDLGGSHGGGPHQEHTRG
jgi:hypothetical protein